MRFMDIGIWFSENEGVCPNCHLDLHRLPPEANVVHHFTGDCNAPEVLATEPPPAHVSYGRRVAAGLWRSLAWLT
jgi:hypothetical protein